MPTWLIANWKMNGNAARVRDWAYRVNQSLAARPSGLTVVYCPPSVYLGDAREASRPSGQLKLGAQDCHQEKSGAYTGGISAAMLADKGCAYVIVGHSECRSGGDCDARVLAKAEAALAAGLCPIICVGESRAQYEAKETLAALDVQLMPLKALPVGGALIAYEPVWAIGSNRTPTTAEITAAHSHIKTTLGSSVDVLYGGSVNPDNAREILALPTVQGALVGGASLEVEPMRALMEIVAAKRVGT